MEKEITTTTLLEDIIKSGSCQDLSRIRQFLIESNKELLEANERLINIHKGMKEENKKLKVENKNWESKIVKLYSFLKSFKEFVDETNKRLEGGEE